MQRFICHVVVWGTVLMLMAPMGGYAQRTQGQALVDSILKVLPGLKDDTDHVWLLNDLAQEYYTTEPDKGIAACQEELSLSKKIHYARGVTTAYTTLGNNYFAKSDFTNATKSWLSALSTNARDDSDGIITIITNLSNVSLYIGEYNKAEAGYKQAINFYVGHPAIKNAGRNLGVLYANLGGTYARDDKLDSAIYTMRTGMQQYKDGGNKVDLARLCMNLGGVYLAIEDYKGALGLLDTAWYLYTDVGSKGGVSRVLTQRMKVYTSVLEDSVASEHFEEIARISKKEFLLASLKTMDSVIAVHKALGALDDIINDYRGLAKIHAQSGNMSGAYHTLRQSYNLRDSLYSDKNAKDLMRLQEQYVFTKREDSLKFIQQLARNGYEQQQQLSAAQFIQQKQKLSLRQSALDLSNKNLTLTQKEKEVQSLAFEKQQGEYYRAEQAKDNRLKLAAEKDKIQLLEIQSSKRTRYGLFAGLLLLASIGALIYRQSRQREKTNYQLALSNRQLDEANRIKARFFGILSHDLRAPISNLTSYLFLQREAPEMMDETSKASHQLTIELAANNLLSVMEDLLLWSKGQMTSFKPIIKSIQILQLFDEIKKLVPHNTSIDVVFDDPGLLKMDTDENFLKTIMRNLTANALKALGNQPGGRVEWKAWKLGGRQYLSITDNGPGLSKEQLENLFSESAVTSASSGLGLHIVRDFAQMLGQKIEVKSEPGRGTSFIMSAAA